MSHLITHAGGSITPLAVTEYKVEQQAGNIVHHILGRTDPDITLRPTGLRSGTLTLVFTTSAAADDARRQHAAGAVFALTSAAVPAINMSYVLAGRLGTIQGNANEWTLTIDFQEVTP